MRAPEMKTICQQLCTALITLLVVVVAGCGDPAAPKNELAAAWDQRVERPNIIVILVDTLRKDRLGFYGNKRDTSPNLDRFADKAVVYENAISQAPRTFPSVSALLTSQFPSAMGIAGIRERLTDKAIFLQEILSENGYETHAIVSHDFIDKKWGFGKGFDSFQSFAGGHRVVTSADVTDSALEIIDGIDADRPTFLLAHYFDAHYLYMEHEEFRFAEPPPDADSEWWLLAFRVLRGKARRGELTPAHREYLLGLYDSELAYADHQIGRILDRLESRGLLDNSIVVFTADHGEEFLDRNGLGHGVTLFNELINVPLAIKWPGVSEGQRTARYVAHVDLMPTVLDYLEIPVEHPIVGMRYQDRTPSDAILSETHWRRDMTAVIMDGKKLFLNERENELHFFDLESDPGELNPLDRIESSGALLAELEAYREHCSTAQLFFGGGSTLDLSEEEVERLRALGYVD